MYISKQNDGHINFKNTLKLLKLYAQNYVCKLGIGKHKI